MYPFTKIENHMEESFYKNVNSVNKGFKNESRTHGIDGKMLIGQYTVGLRGKNLSISHCVSPGKSDKNMFHNSTGIDLVQLTV